MSVETTVGSRHLVLLENRPVLEYTRRCRACGAFLEAVGSLGTQYVVDFPEVAAKRDGLQAPLDVAMCPNCKLVQLQHTVNPDRLFKKFWYRSGINEQMKLALQDVAIKAMKLTGPLLAGDAVCDVGSNDGTLLRLFHTAEVAAMGGPAGRIHTVGFEPCDELVHVAEESKTSEVIFNTFFQRGVKVDALLHKWHQVGFKIIFALAMFYDVDNPGVFLKDVYDLLHTDGLFIIQMNHLKGMLKNNAFDNINHEHLCYYTLTSLMHVMSQAGFRVLDVEENDVNGGSIRVYASVDGSNLRPPMGGLQRVEAVLEAEKEITQASLVELFVKQNEISSALSMFIRKVSDMGQKVYVYGASTRGTTLLQTLDPDVWPLLLGAAERDERKYGRCMVGTWTPIVPEDEARAKANYLLVLPWAFLPGMLEREKLWMEGGGEFIVPLPIPRIVSLAGERNLL